MYSTDEVLYILKVNKPKLEKDYSISELALFGSYARRENNEQSDIDILVSFDKSVGIEFIRLAHSLEDLLKSKVDLVSRNGIKAYYLPFIEKSLIHV